MLRHGIAVDGARSIAAAATAMTLLTFVSTAAFAAEYGKFFPVNPQGTYLATNPGDIPVQPTKIEIDKLRLRPGDYIGLRRVGAFDAWGDGSKDFVDSMVGVFGDGNALLQPGDFGQLSDAETLILPGIPEDFSLYGDTELGRLPADTQFIALSTNDIFFRDNTDPNGDYGIRITRPNRNKLVGARTQALAGMEAEDDSIPLDIVTKLLESTPKECKNYKVSNPRDLRSIGAIPPVPMPQYRGWQVGSDTPKKNAVNSGWRPRSSEWHGRRDGSHNGIDIFAPRGSTLLAPLDGCGEYDEWPKFGRVFAIRFRVNGEPRLLFLAHTDAYIAPNSQNVSKGQPVASAGCTGKSAESQLCGEDLAPEGGRTDHVHVQYCEILYPTKKNQRAGCFDPAAIFGWAIATTDPNPTK